MRLLVVGAGSTGGYFGGRLAHAGRDVTFLVRPARAEELRRRGLEIISPHGDATIQPKLVTAGEIDGAYDAVLLTVKGFALEPAMDDIEPAIGPETAILPVLNGMRHMNRLQECFGPEAVGGCACKCATILDDDGRIVQLAKHHDLVFGELHGQVSPRMKVLEAFMTDAGFDTRLSPVIEREMWEKWILLAAIGAITCLMRGSLGEVQAAPGGREFVLALLDEVTAIVTRVGVLPSPAYIGAIRAQLTQKGSTQTSSMYRDLEKGNRIEVDEIVGDLLRRGAEAGLATPLLAAAYSHLCGYSAHSTHK